jgi:hypothetical protein
MRVLVEKLKKEHREILDTLEEIRALGIYSDEVLLKLEKLKDEISRHFLKEDDGVFRVLFLQAKNDEGLSRLLNFFSKESSAVSEHICTFFKKYKESDESFDFHTECSRLIEVFKSLIRKEEEYLFVELEKIYYKTKT